MKRFTKLLLKRILSGIMLCFLGTLAFADPEHITISGEWSKKDEKEKKLILFQVGLCMQQKNTAEKTFRLVIDGEEVYISNGSGETWSSWGASFLKGGTACEHNISTHKALLDLIYNPTQEDSRYRLLRNMHSDQASSIEKIEQKDITIEVLANFLEAGFKGDYIPFSTK